MSSVTSFVYGLVYSALFILLGPVVALLWLVAGVLTGLGVRFKMTGARAGLFILGYGVGFAGLEAEQHLRCPAPGCQSASLASDSVWIAVTLAVASTALAMLSYFGRRGAGTGGRQTVSWRRTSLVIVACLTVMIVILAATSYYFGTARTR